jgi:hypothetical protein
MRVSGASWVCANGLRFEKGVVRVPLQTRQRFRQPNRGTREIATRGRDVRVAQKITHIVEVRRRFEQRAGKLSPQIMEMQIEAAQHRPAFGCPRWTG